MDMWITICAAVLVAAGLALLITRYRHGNKKKHISAPVLQLKPVQEAPDTTHAIHFLPTESSDAILLESDGHFALVDAAEDSDNPRGFPELAYRGYENEVLAYLKKVAADENGIVHLDFILGTHAHSDHLGGFDTVIADDAVRIDRAYLKRYDESRIRASEVERWDNREVYEQMVAALNARHIPIIDDITEPAFTLGKMQIHLFNTEYDTVHTDIGENDNAIGLLAELYGIKVFLAADIDNKTGDEDRLAPQIGKVDLLKVGHHSYAGSTTENWLRALMPKACVVTNRTESIDPRTLDRITRLCHCPILITGKEKGVVAVFGNDGTLAYYNEIM